MTSKRAVGPEEVKLFLTNFVLFGTPLGEFEKHLKTIPYLSPPAFDSDRSACLESGEYGGTRTQPKIMIKEGASSSIDLHDSSLAGDLSHDPEMICTRVLDLLAKAANLRADFPESFPSERFGPRGEMLAILSAYYRMSLPEKEIYRPGFDQKELKELNDSTMNRAARLYDILFYRGPRRDFDVIYNGFKQSSGNPWPIGFFFDRVTETIPGERPFTIEVVFESATALVNDPKSERYYRLNPHYDPVHAYTFFRRREIGKEEVSSGQREVGVYWESGPFPTQSFRVGRDDLADTLEKTYQDLSRRSSGTGNSMR